MLGVVLIPGQFRTLRGPAVKVLWLVLLAMPVVAVAQEAPVRYAPGSALVVATPRYPFAAVEVAGAVRGGEVVEMSLVEAMRVAKADGNISGVVNIDLTTDSLIERGRVVCYDKVGRKAWEERVMFNMGGSADRLAEKFASRLADKARGKSCP